MSISNVFYENAPSNVLTESNISDILTESNISDANYLNSVINVDNVHEMIRNLMVKNPSFLLNNTLLSKIMQIIPVYEFLTIISEDVKIYDQVNSLQGFWKSYYLYVHPHTTIINDFMSMSCIENEYYVLPNIIDEKGTDIPQLTSEFITAKISKEITFSERQKLAEKLLMKDVKDTNYILKKIDTHDIKKINMSPHHMVILYENGEVYNYIYINEPGLVPSKVKDMCSIISFTNDNMTNTSAILKYDGNVIFISRYNNLNTYLYFDPNFMKSKYGIEGFINVKNDSTDIHSIILEDTKHRLYYMNSAIINVMEDEIIESVSNQSQLIAKERAFLEKDFTEENFKMIAPDVIFEQEIDTSFDQLINSKDLTLYTTYSFGTDATFTFRYITTTRKLYFHINTLHVVRDGENMSDYNTVDNYDITELNPMISELHIEDIFFYQEFGNESLNLIIKHDDKLSKISIGKMLPNDNSTIIDYELKPANLSNQYDVEKMSKITYDGKKLLFIDSLKDLYLKETITARDFLRPKEEIERFLFTHYNEIINILKKRGIELPSGKEKYTKLMENVLEMLDYGNGYVLNVNVNEYVIVPYEHYLLEFHLGHIKKDEVIDNYIKFEITLNNLKYKTFIKP